MNEDLISRKALRRKLIDRQITTVFYDNAKRHEVGCIIEMLDNAPAVDAVEVVRCKDCKRRDTVYCAMDINILDVADDMFCSFGERRADDATD